MNLFWRGGRGLSEEMRFHQEQLRAEGWSAGEASRAFGNELRWRERARDAAGGVWLEALLRDVRLAARQLRRAPGVTAVVILTLALGIGANTAVFSVVNANLLRTLPVKDPAQLTLLYWHTPRFPADLNDSGTDDGLPPRGGAAASEMYSIAYPDFQALQAPAASVTSALFGFAPLDDPETTVVLRGSAETARASVVTASYFQGLGIAAARGRTLLPTDFAPGAPLAAVISDAFWAQHFARSPAALGATVRVQTLTAVIVGVAPPGFEGVQPGFRVELWLPLTPNNRLLPWGYQPRRQPLYTGTDYWWLEAMARRRPGVSQATLLAALAPTFNADSARDVRPLMRPGDVPPRLAAVAGAHGINDLADYYGATLKVLVCGVGVLLLLACVNVAALLLARAAARRREIGVRLALGASRARLVMQLLIESMLLALLGGAAGLAAAPAGVSVLNGWLSGGDVLPASAPTDWRVAGFALAVSLVAGVLFGLAPALRSTRMDLTHSMKPGPAGGERGRWMRTDKSLAVAQTALSLLLLAGAGLMLRTWLHLTHERLGFDPAGVLTFQLDARSAGHAPAGLPGFYLNVQRRIAALPGVAAVSASQHALLSGDEGGDAVRIPSSPTPQLRHGIMRNGVGPGFFATMRIPILRGREIDERDVRTGAAVAVISTGLAQRYFGGKDPLGQALVRVDSKTSGTAFTIVGVAADARYANLTRPVPPEYYVPYTRLDSLYGLAFEVRTGGAPATALAAIRKTVHDLDPNLPLTHVQSQTDLDVTTLGSERLLARLGGCFAALGLLLAALGIEGTMAYAVSRRTRDIGVRMALGAESGRVQRDVLRETMVIAAFGLAAGMALALGFARLLANYLHGVSAQDPATLATAAGVLVAAAGVAGWLPARRAARVDPIAALRCE